MAKLVADKQTEAVVRVANRSRQAKVDKANAAAVAAAPLLAWAGMVEQQPPPAVETVEDRLDLRRRVIAGTYRTTVIRAERDAQLMASARWYAYLCSLHPDAPPGLDGYFAARWRHGGPVIALIAAKQTWAKLLSGHPVIDDFTVTPAPWNELVRRWWDRLDLTPAERRTAADAERAAYQAAHPEETAAWNARLAAKAARQTAERLDYNAPKFWA